MAKLLWDQVGQHLYETGIDHGVLYLTSGAGIPWSGLTGVEEDFGGDASTPNYFDGIKSQDIPSFGDFSATLTAFTYPDEFLEFEGVASLGNGLFVDGQSSKTFGLSYRTLVGNDTDNTEHGYRIHLVYNLTAASDTTNYETFNDSPSPLEFNWKITGLPKEVSGYRPTAHLIIDSRFLNDSMLEGIEEIIYGNDIDNARLPTIDELIDIAASWDPRSIVPQIISGLAQLIPGFGDLTPGVAPGLYYALPNTRLTETDVEGLYQLT